MNTGAAGNLCKRRTVKSETRHPAPNQFACWHPALKVFCMLGLCKDLGCDKLAGCAYGAVIDKGIARWGGGSLHQAACKICTFNDLFKQSQQLQMCGCKLQFFVHTHR